MNFALKSLPDVVLKYLIYCAPDTYNIENFMIWVLKRIRTATAKNIIYTHKFCESVKNMIFHSNFHKVIITTILKKCNNCTINTCNAKSPEKRCDVLMIQSFDSFVGCYDWAFQMCNNRFNKTIISDIFNSLVKNTGNKQGFVWFLWNFSCILR